MEPTHPGQLGSHRSLSCGSVLCLCVCVEVLQDKQLCRTGKPPQFPADPPGVRADLSVWDRFGALQHLSSAVCHDGSLLLPRCLQPVQVQHSIYHKHVFIYYM